MNHSKAKSVAKELSDCGIVFPVDYSTALKYRNVGPKTVAAWIELGLCHPPTKTESQSEARRMKLLDSLKWHQEHIDRIREILKNTT